MSNLRKIFFLLIAIVLSGFMSVFAQGGNHNHGGYFDPDSLTLVTVSGTAMVDTFMTQSIGVRHLFL